MINIRTNIQSKESKLIQEESTESSEHSKGTCGNRISSRRGIAHGSCLGTEKVRQAGPELFCAWLSIAVGKRLESTSEVGSVQISRLVGTLTAARVQFDPTICLDGPLYFSSVVDGPPPLWERFGIKLGGRSSAGNIQGQQYRYRDDERSVVNYAEILGKAFHLRAYGTYEKDDGNKEEEDAPSPFDNVLAFLGGGISSSTSNLIQCPADFTVKVTKGTFCLLGKQLDIPISGTGYLRVLYADEQLRIFVSPKSTTDDRWEKAGLMVAQVNIGLVDEGSFEDLCAASE